MSGSPMGPPVRRCCLQRSSPDGPQLNTELPWCDVHTKILSRVEGSKEEMCLPRTEVSGRTGVACQNGECFAFLQTKTPGCRDFVLVLARFHSWWQTARWRLYVVGASVRGYMYSGTASRVWVLPNFTC